MEGCIAVLTASISTFRMVIVSQGRRESDKKRWRPADSWIQRARQRKKMQLDEYAEGDRRPSIPRAMLTGMRTLIRTNIRTAEETVTTGSDTLTLDQENETQSVFSIEFSPHEEHMPAKPEGRIESPVSAQHYGVKYLKSAYQVS